MRCYLKNVPFIALWMALVILFGCKTNENLSFPAPLSDTIPIVVPISTFHIPISYPVAELENFLNQKIKGQFFETTLSPTKNDKDQVKVEMTKLKRIEISSIREQLVCKIPLHVKGSILKSRLNFMTKGIEPVETDLVIELRTSVDLNKGWNLITKFQLAEIKWVSPPIVTIAGINFNLQKKLEDFLVKNQDKLTGLLDQEINKAVSLDKAVGKIWLDLQKPMVVVKKPPRAFIRFVNHDISGDFKLLEDDLVCFTTIKAQVAMVTETNMKVPKVLLPGFKASVQNSDHSDVYVYAFAEFEEIEEELSTKLKGKKLTVKQFSATIKEIETYASDSGLTVLIKTKGDIVATMAASVTPSFDSVKQTVRMDNFQFQIITDNVLLNMGDAVLHDKVRDTVQTYLAVELDSLILKIPALIEGAISKGKSGKSIDLSISEFNIRSCDIKMDSKRLHFLVHTQLKSGIAIKHLNAGKGIKIKPKKKKK